MPCSFRRCSPPGPTAASTSSWLTWPRCSTGWTRPCPDGWPWPPASPGDSWPRGARSRRPRGRPARGRSCSRRWPRCGRWWPAARSRSAPRRRRRGPARWTMSCRTWRGTSRVAPRSGRITRREPDAVRDPGARRVGYAARGDAAGPERRARRRRRRRRLLPAGHREHRPARSTTGRPRRGVLLERAHVRGPVARAVVAVAAVHARQRRLLLGLGVTVRAGARTSRAPPAGDAAATARPVVDVHVRAEHRVGVDGSGRVAVPAPGTRGHPAVAEVDALAVAEPPAAPARPDRGRAARDGGPVVAAGQPDLVAHRTDGGAGRAVHAGVHAAR